MLWDCKSLTFKAGSPGGQYSLLLSLSLFFFSVKSTASNSLEGTKESKLSLYKYRNTYAHYFYLAWKNACFFLSSVPLALSEGLLHSDCFVVQQLGDISPPHYKLQSAVGS